MAKAHAGGFTLIELMTAITLFAILSLLAMPMYTSFMANTQIRTASESMLAGLKLAQTEAVKRNGNVEFVLDEKTGWQVNDVSDPDKVSPISEAGFGDGAAKTVITPADDSRRVAFNGLGRVLRASPIDGTAPLWQVDVTTSFSNVSNARALRLVIGNPIKGTDGIKLCDPQLDPTDPAGCP